LKEFKGLGDVGVDIFFREVQVAWQELRPFADRRTLDAAGRLGLPKDAGKLATWSATMTTRGSSPRSCASSSTTTTTPCARTPERRPASPPSATDPGERQPVLQTRAIASRREPAGLVAGIDGEPVGALLDREPASAVEVLAVTGQPETAA
jgi:hypothetical protein